MVVVQSDLWVVDTRPKVAGYDLNPRAIFPADLMKNDLSATGVLQDILGQLSYCHSG